jgi:hypothetical protein
MLVRFRSQFLPAGMLRSPMGARTALRRIGLYVAVPVYSILAVKETTLVVSPSYNDDKLDVRAGEGGEDHHRVYRSRVV